VNVLAVVTDFGADPYRRRAARIVRAWLAELDGWRVESVTVAPTDAPGRDRSAARNVLLDEDLGADVFYFADGDSLVPHEQLEAAVELAHERPGLVFAYDSYRRLSREHTELVTVENAELAFELPPTIVFPNSGSTGAVALTPAFFRQVGGYDEAYVHGFEDLDFAYRCSLEAPVRRVPGPLMHMWHPRPDIEPEAWPADLERYTAVTGGGWETVVHG
jgi:hypothetical protein